MGRSAAVICQSVIGFVTADAASPNQSLVVHSCRFLYRSLPDATFLFNVIAVAELELFNPESSLYVKSYQSLTQYADGVSNNSFIIISNYIVSVLVFY